MAKIAEVLDVGYEQIFVLDNGEKVGKIVRKGKVESVDA